MVAVSSDGRALADVAAEGVLVSAEDTPGVLLGAGTEAGDEIGALLAPADTVEGGIGALGVAVRMRVDRSSSKANI